MACESLGWGLVKKGGEGGETRLGAAALEKQVRAGIKSTIPRGSPSGSKSSSSACKPRFDPVHWLLLFYQWDQY